MPKPARTDSEGAGAESTKPEATNTTTILFVRHGLTPTTGQQLPGRAPGLHLSDDGRAQADRVGRHLAGLGEDGKPLVTAVYASPLERTVETAERIAAPFDLGVRPEPGLLEADMGSWTGMELAAARDLPGWKRVQRQPSSFRFPEGESFVEMQARLLGLVERLREGHPGETLVAVSHADPIRALVSHALGAHLDLFQRVMVSPCSLTAVAYGEGGPMVLAVNSTDLSAVFGA